MFVQSYKVETLFCSFMPHPKSRDYDQSEFLRIDVKCPMSRFTVKASA